MSVVVTGAAGFIGRHLVAFLTARGDRVTAIDRRPGSPAAASELLADLTDPSADAVDCALREAAAVFHLAGRAGVRDHGARPELLQALRWRDNVLSTERVLSRVPPDVPLVVVSSSSVYGGAAHGGRRPSREDDPPRPLGGYGRTKLEAERRCARRRAAGGCVAVVRPFTVAGEGQRPDMAIARWLRAASEGEPLQVIGSLDRQRDLTDVSQVVEGLVGAADRGVCGTVNLGTGVGRSLRSVIAAVGAVLDVNPAVSVVPAGPEEPATTLAATSRCRRWLGFVPRTDLPQLVHRQALAAGLPVADAVPQATSPWAACGAVPGQHQSARPLATVEP